MPHDRDYDWRARARAGEALRLGAATAGEPLLDAASHGRVGRRVLIRVPASPGLRCSGPGPRPTRTVTVMQGPGDIQASRAGPNWQTGPGW